MDQSLLVKNGYRFLAALDKTIFCPVAALWFHDTEADVWRLWVVPDLKKPDKQEFYRTVSTIFSQAGQNIDISPSAVRLIARDHPAIAALSEMFRVEGVSEVSVSNNMLNGFLMLEGIILRMSFEASRSTAA